jgi:hypothetical protein
MWHDNTQCHLFENRLSETEEFNHKRIFDWCKRAHKMCDPYPKSMLSIAATHPINCALGETSAKTKNKVRVSNKVVDAI